MVACNYKCNWVAIKLVYIFIPHRIKVSTNEANKEAIKTANFFYWKGTFKWKSRPHPIKQSFRKFPLNNSGSLWLAVQYILASSVILWGKNSFSIRRKWHFDLRTKLFCMPYPYFNPECNKLNQFEPLFKKWNELKSWICTLYIFQSK